VFEPRCWAGWRYICALSYTDLSLAEIASKAFGGFRQLKKALSKQSKYWWIEMVKKRKGVLMRCGLSTNKGVKLNPFRTRKRTWFHLTELYVLLSYEFQRTASRLWQLPCAASPRFWKCSLKCNLSSCTDLIKDIERRHSNLRKKFKVSYLLGQVQEWTLWQLMMSRSLEYYTFVCLARPTQIWYRAASSHSYFIQPSKLLVLASSWSSSSCFPCQRTQRMHDLCLHCQDLWLCRFGWSSSRWWMPPQPCWASGPPLAT